MESITGGDQWCLRKAEEHKFITKPRENCAHVGGSTCHAGTSAYSKRSGRRDSGISREGLSVGGSNIVNQGHLVALIVFLYGKCR